MPLEYTKVPDWFSWENQGGGVAVVALDGAQHLLVMMVDSGPAQNRGLFRLGKDLNDRGVVTGGWTAWTDVPDWFSWENQGADVAVTDLGAGVQDLIVLLIDNGPAKNRAFYRVGHDLRIDGSIRNGWSGWQEIPDWFSWENQGGGITVLGPDSQGRRDLVVFMVDNGPGLNQGLYRIGRQLDKDGMVTGGWSPWREVPGWFSWANQGAAVTSDGASRDLLFFQIDDAPVIPGVSGQNQAFFRFATGLDADGTSQNWGQEWLGVPHWFSWNNQGGGAAIATLNGTKKLFALLIDAPEGQNGGYYQSMDLDMTPSLYGSWEVKTFHSSVLAVHTALLKTGDVLFFAGSGSSKTRFESHDFGDIAKGVPLSAVWSPPDDKFSHPPTLVIGGRPYDLFCGGDTALADGRLLSAGGTQTYPFTGSKDAAVFDPSTGTWSLLSAMAHARWYPTVITLGDGSVLAASGLDEKFEGSSRAVLEMYEPVADAWHDLPFPHGSLGLPLYAHLFLLEDGRVFFSGGRMDDVLDVQPCVITLAAHGVPSVQEVPDLLDPALRNQSASVLLPPAQDQRVLICGGGPEGKENKTHATDGVSIVDFKAAAPSYKPAQPMALGRIHLNAVILPDRTVFVSGGSLKQESEPLARLQSELYDPATDTWRLMATAQVPRLYHSTAVLLPTGQVVAAGGNPEGGSQAVFEPPDPNEEMRIEVFSPPYLFRGDRPLIKGAPSSSTYGVDIEITTAEAGDIKWASLVRPGVTTHSFDTSQRLVDLEITSRDAETVTAKVPGNPNLAPPGWYMLFIVNQQGVPSEATWLSLHQ
ncbi:hypothetical protein QFZ65_002474 [Arthrobacter sp. B3I9]|uniref:galactose oxidase-like domain-containing protein n=1 Tax=Arthrobacter sp. B3I9 TaxID=3042270 RepID=UPI00278D8863|nr:galactose oxidase-like domain-containing protein [Arthrobacter sp. B3I9]MDQ0850536.1 hypothetical protein [Arthrobacter sp. B3I9]